jgi:Zn-dependent protease
MKWSVKLITIKGITLYLHFTFLLFVAWMITVNLASGMQVAQLLWTTAFLAAVFASIALHEYGHAFIAAYFGINAKHIVFYPIGGIASIEKLPENPRQELLISSAGPAVSFVLAAFCWLLAPQSAFVANYQNFAGIIHSGNFFLLLGTVNLVLGAFNLVPAFPLDGGRMLRALLAFKMNYVRATTVAASIGKAIAALFVVYGLVYLNFLLVVVGLFIILFAQAEEAYLQLRKLVADYRLKDMLMYDYDSLDATTTVSSAIGVLQRNHSRQFIVTADGLPVGTLARKEVMKAVADQQYNVTVGALMEDDLVVLDGDKSAADVLQKLSSNEERLYPVMEKGRFAGVINFQQVIEYLLLHKTHEKDFAKTKSLVELV